MNILYLHGLKSKLNPEKRKVLEQYGRVFTPDIDYENGHIQPVEILKNFPGTEFNVLIGSSMGALNAYIISENIGRPTLIFNPPLSIYQKINFSSRFTKGSAFKQIVLGGSDVVVKPSETMKFLGNHLQEFEMEIVIDPHLSHRIPIEIFQEQVQSFFSKLCY